MSQAVSEPASTPEAAIELHCACSEESEIFAQHAVSCAHVCGPGEPLLELDELLELGPAVKQLGNGQAFPHVVRSQALGDAPHAAMHCESAHEHFCWQAMYFAPAPPNVPDL